MHFIALYSIFVCLSHNTVMLASLSSVSTCGSVLKNVVVLFSVGDGFEQMISASLIDHLSIFFFFVLLLVVPPVLFLFIRSSACSSLL